MNLSQLEGLFDAKVTSAETCQGPKRKDCCFNTLHTHDNKLIAEMDCKQNVLLNKAKIIAVKNHQKVRLQMDKPCGHVFLKPLFMKTFNVTESCIIKKNVYHFNVDYGEMAEKYYRGMFLYGDWTFKSMFYSDDCNLFCMNLNVTMEPKKVQ